jgi:hypothetical protein
LARALQNNHAASVKMRQVWSETPRHAVFSHRQQHFRPLDDPPKKTGNAQKQTDTAKGGDHQGTWLLFNIVVHILTIPRCPSHGKHIRPLSSIACAATHQNFTIILANV